MNGQRTIKAFDRHRFKAAALWIWMWCTCRVVAYALSVFSHAADAGGEELCDDGQTLVGARRVVIALGPWVGVVGHDGDP